MKKELPDFDRNIRIEYYEEAVNYHGYILTGVDMIGDVDAVLKHTLRHFYKSGRYDGCVIQSIKLVKMYEPSSGKPYKVIRNLADNFPRE